MLREGRQGERKSERQIAAEGKKESECMCQCVREKEGGTVSQTQKERHRQRQKVSAQESESVFETIITFCPMSKFSGLMSLCITCLV